MLTKTEIRNQIQEIRNNLLEKDVYKNSKIIQEKLFNMEEYKRSKAIFIYMSFNREVDTRDIIRDSLNKGKRVAIPKIVNGEMEFYYINNINDVEIGCFGVQEPIAIEGLAYFRDCEDSAFMIMPGVAFDHKKHRIGYGKGFYDKYLMKYGHDNNGKFSKIALAFDFQVLEEIPCESYDILPDMIITDKEIVN